MLSTVRTRQPEANLTDTVAKATSPAAITALTQKLDALAEQRDLIREQQRGGDASLSRGDKPQPKRTIWKPGRRGNGRP